MIETILVLVLCLGLFLGAVARPWLALPILLALLPFNGVLLDVITVRLGLPATTRTLLAGWHDSLALGFIVAAGLSWIGSRRWRLNAVELATGFLLVTGIVSVLVATNTETALYAYRNLYEPILLSVAIAALAQSKGLPAWVRPRVSAAIVGAAVLAALFAGWQVYVGGYQYLTEYYRTADGHLPTAYMASFILQPRAIGTFHSPNEFGAYLALAIGILIAPKVFPGRGAIRAWSLAILGLALLLTLSRSAWLGTLIILVAIALIGPERRARFAAFAARLRTREWLLVHGPAALTFLILAGTIVISSGAIIYVTATLTGHEPSSAGRIETIQTAIQDLFPPADTLAPGSTPKPGASPGSSANLTNRPRIGLFGMGLGMAGPKSSRFGEVAVDNFVSSEIWYVDYLLQAGLIGLVALVTLVLSVAWRLLRARDRPWATAALAIGAGLAAGALVIPVIDEPTVAIPLWTTIGLALATTQSGNPRSRTAATTNPGESAVT